MRSSFHAPCNARRALCTTLLSLGLWLAPSAGQAQLNVEALATTVDDPGHHGLLNSGLSLDAGNVSLFEVTGEGAYVFTNAHPEAPEDQDARGFWFRDRFLTNAGASFKKTPDETLANGGFVHLRYTRMQWLRVGLEAFFQLQYDEFRLLTRRVLGGVGGRFVITRVKNFALWCGSGYMAEGEKREILEEDRPPQGPDPVRMVNHRWNNYLTLIALQDSERASVANTVYLQPRFDDPADIQILDELSLNASLSEIFSLSLGLTVRYDSRAPRSVETYDVRLTQGFSVRI